MNLSNNKYNFPDDEYKRVKLHRLTKKDDYQLPKNASYFYAMRRIIDVLPGRVGNYIKPYLLSNIQVLMDHMKLRLILSDLKTRAEMYNDNSNEYKSSQFSVFYTRLSNFYTMLCVFILQIVHILYWEKFDIVQYVSIISEHSGMSLNHCLQIAMKIGRKIKSEFEQSMQTEYQMDPLIKKLFDDEMFFMGEQLAPGTSTYQRHIAVTSDPDYTNKIIQQFKVEKQQQTFIKQQKELKKQQKIEAQQQQQQQQKSIHIDTFSDLE